jgi:tRNA (cmo5U34)-methyltransferase
MAAKVLIIDRDKHMTHYDESRWSDSEFSDKYTNHADDIILERRRLIGVLLSYYGKFHADRERVRTLDMGCGDGTLTHELVGRFGNVSPTLLDGSADMLNKAKALLEGGDRAEFIHASFEEILSGKVTLDWGYGLIFSSLAIHHLYATQKAALYQVAYEKLQPGGGFMNIDVVLPPSGRLESWYFNTWHDYVEARAKSTGIPEFGDIPRFYKENEDNKPDSLDDQLNMLRAAGFAETDCYYKDGIFAVFGGVKP